MNLLQLESFWSVKESTRNGSRMWHKLLKYPPIANVFCNVEVKNGETTSFWYDRWSEMGCLIDIVGPRRVIDMGIKLTATVAEAWQTRQRRKHIISILKTLSKLRVNVECWDQRMWLTGELRETILSHLSQQGIHGIMFDQLRVKSIGIRGFDSLM